MNEKNEFIFTDEMIRRALEANGYREHWHKDNWVPEETQSDFAGDTPLNCFKRLLKDNNLY